MSYLENAFTAKMRFSGFKIEGTLAFQYVKNSSTFTQGTGIYGAGGASSSTELVTDDYLYGITALGANPALFHFAPVGSLGRFVVTVLEPFKYKGQYLGISNLSYTRAYNSESNSNHFWFTRNGEVVTLKDFASVNEGLTLQCAKGPVKCWDDGKIIRVSGSDTQWSIYTGVDTSGDTLNDRIKLIIVERDVAKS